MVKCTQCGFQNEHEKGFCDSCGYKLPKIIPMEIKSSKENEYSRTMLLTIVLIINYISIIILGLVGVLILILGIMQIVLGSTSGISPFELIIFTVIPLVIVLLWLYLTYSVQSYNNKARYVMIIYFVIDLIISIYLFSIIGLILSAFIVYVLIFDSKTVKLFT